MELNERQLEAVTSPLNPMLVFAGPGAGKTRVLTERIAALIDEPFNLKPETILAITFTNKAVGEMRQRLEQRVGHNAARKVAVSTIHSWCLSILRTYSWAIDIDTDFSIADEPTKLHLLESCVNSTNRKSLEYVADLLSRFRFGLDLIGIETEPATLEKWLARYEAQLELYNMLDFDLLLLKTQELLSTNAKILHEVSRKYSCVLVDEFQDTDKIQYDIIRMVTQEHKNTFVVCDDDQSIYLFRGANIENIERFRRDFQPKEILLEINYRSTREIVSAANTVMDIGRTAKKAIRSINRGGVTPSIIQPTDETDLQYELMKHITDVLKTTTPEETAILCPANYIVQQVSDWLSEQHIHHYTSTGDALSQYKNMHLLLLYLKIIHADMLKDTRKMSLAVSLLYEVEHVIPADMQRSIKSFVCSEKPLSNIVAEVLNKADDRLDLGFSKEQLAQLGASVDAVNTVIDEMCVYVECEAKAIKDVIGYIDILFQDTVSALRDMEFGVNTESYENAGLLEYALSQKGAVSIHIECQKGHRVASEYIMHNIISKMCEPGTIYGHDFTEASTPTITIRVHKEVIVFTDIYSLYASAMFLPVTRRSCFEIDPTYSIVSAAVSMCFMCMQDSAYMEMVFLDHDRCKFLYAGLSEAVAHLKDYDIPGEVVGNIKTFMYFMPIEQKIKDRQHKDVLDMLMERVSRPKLPLTQEIGQAIQRMTLSTEYALLERTGVHVLSIHAAKGMEFHNVSIVGCEDYSLPSFHAIKRDEKGDGRFLAEQRRVFYVAMTRAKDVLTLFSVQKSGKREKKLSRFIDIDSMGCFNTIR